MTIADKLEIANLIADAASMKKLADTMKQNYHDEKIAEFAKSAIDDNNETKNYICKIIEKNLDIFFDLDNLRVDNGGFGYSFFENRGIVHHFGKFLKVIFMFHPRSCRNYWRGNAGGLYTTATPDEIEILDVYASTSDTSLPEYKVFTAWSLTDPNAEKNGRVFALFGKYDAKTWNKIYHLATWSKEQTKLLWRSFTEVVKDRVTKFKGSADEMQSLFNKNKEVCP